MMAAPPPMMYLASIVFSVMAKISWAGFFLDFPEIVKSIIFPKEIHQIPCDFPKFFACGGPNFLKSKHFSDFQNFLGPTENFLGNLNWDSHKKNYMRGSAMAETPVSTLLISSSEELSRNLPGLFVYLTTFETRQLFGLLVPWIPKIRKSKKKRFCY